MRVSPRLRAAVVSGTLVAAGRGPPGPRRLVRQHERSAPPPGVVQVGSARSPSPRDRESQQLQALLCRRHVAPLQGEGPAASSRQGQRAPKVRPSDPAHPGGSLPGQEHPPAAPKAVQLIALGQLGGSPREAARSPRSAGRSPPPVSGTATRLSEDQPGGPRTVPGPVQAAAAYPPTGHGTSTTTTHWCHHPVFCHSEVGRRCTR